VAPVRLGIFGGIRGLQAATELRAGDIALRIPRRCCLTSDAISDSSRAAGNDPLERFAFFLAEQRLLGDASWWAPYIAMLPTYTDYVRILPLAYVAAMREHREQPAKSMDSLHDFPIVQEATEAEVSLWRAWQQYNTLDLSSYQNQKRISWTDLVWGMSVVQTRVLSIEGGFAIVPVFDLGNTFSTPAGGGEQSLIWHQQFENGSFIGRASVDMAEGAEWTFRYWFHTTEVSSLLHYGFRAGEGSWRPVWSPADASCGRWLTAAEAIATEEASTPVTINIAELVRQHCDSTAGIMVRELRARSSTYHTWLRAVLQGDLRYIVHAAGLRYGDIDPSRVARTWD